MLKRINKFLNKNASFSQNPELKGLNDQFYYLLEYEKDLLKHIVKENFKYYFYHKKGYVATFLGILLLKISLIILLVGGTLYMLREMNVIDVSPVKHIKEVKVAYCPDWDTSNYKKLIHDGYEVNIFYPYSPKKTWEEFKLQIAKIETKGLTKELSYKAKSKSGEYWGRYQLGKSAREAAGLANITWKEFSQNPEMQEGAFLSWMRKLHNTCESMNLYNKYVGLYVNGVEITESGLLALCHNVGVGGAITYIKSNGQDTSIGGYPKKFVKIGGYRLTF